MRYLWNKNRMFSSLSAYLVSSWQLIMATAFWLSNETLLTILAINSSQSFSDWAIADVHQQLLFFREWTTLKISICAKLVASNLVAGSIFTVSHLFTSIRIRSGKYPLWMKKKKKRWRARNSNSIQKTRKYFLCNLWILLGALWDKLKRQRIFPMLG
jgi:hypothetical protein